MISVYRHYVNEEAVLFFFATLLIWANFAGYFDCSAINGLG